MPKKVIPSKEECLKLFKYYESIGFRRLSNDEIREELKEKETVSTVAVKGKGTGFKRQYVREKENTHIRTRIYTNYSDAIGGVDPLGHALAYVEDNRPEATVSLVSSDILLTEHFITRMMEYGEAFADFADNYPFDPECGNLLILQYIPGVMNEMYFTCKVKKTGHVHRKRRVEIYFLDIPISEKSKKFFKRMFDAYTRRIQKKGNDKNFVPRRVRRAEKNVPRTSNMPEQSNSTTKSTHLEKIYNDRGHAE